MSLLALHFSSCWNKLHPTNTKLKPSPTTKLKFNLQPVSYRAIIKALAEKHTYTYKPKERSYRVAMKNMHYSIGPADIKAEIEKLGHQVVNIWNITQNCTKLPLSIFLLNSNLRRTTRTYFSLNICNNVKSNLKLLNTNGK
jgi:hypothetical protein